MLRAKLSGFMIGIVMLNLIKGMVLFYNFGILYKQKQY
jgi:hypothetical protein